MEFFNYNQDFFRLRQFYFVAQAGSLSGAAKLLKMTHPSLSKSMQTLEFRLKAKLFERVPKGIKLTADGERLFDHVSKLFRENDEFLRTFFNDGDELQGEIKIITTPVMAETELTACLLPFIEKYPKLKINIVTTIEIFDVTDVDVAIRTFIPQREDLEQLYIYTHHLKLWASVQYLEKFWTPKSHQELDHHRILAYGKHKNKNFYFDIINIDWIDWILRINNKPDSPLEPFYTITSHEGLHNAACKGYGIIQLPAEWIKTKNSPLIEVLPELEKPKAKLYFIFNKKNPRLRRIMTLYEHLKNILGEKT